MNTMIIKAKCVNIIWTRSLLHEDDITPLSYTMNTEFYDIDGWPIYGSIVNDNHTILEVGQTLDLEVTVSAPEQTLILALMKNEP